MPSSKSGNLKSGKNHTTKIKIVSFNLLKDLRYWDLRKNLIIEELKRLSPDIVGLQEASTVIDNAQWIAKQLKGYKVFLCPRPSNKKRSDTIAILSKLPVIDYQTISLKYQDRVAQMLQVRKGKKEFTFVNTHIYWHILDTKARWIQIKKIISWTKNKNPLIITGDFNALPGSKSIRMMKQQFISAYQEIHGREPHHTFPTPLKGGMRPHNVLRKTAILIAGPFAHRRFRGWKGTVDYIFVNKSIKIIDAKTVMHKNSHKNKKIYPSDHFGLYTEVSI